MQPDHAHDEAERITRVRMRVKTASEDADQVGRLGCEQRRFAERPT